MILKNRNEVEALIFFQPKHNSLSYPANQKMIDILMEHFKLVDKDINPEFFSVIFRFISYHDTPEEALSYYNSQGFFNIYDEEKLRKDFIVVDMDPDDHPEDRPVLVINKFLFKDKIVKFYYDNGQTN